MSTRRVALLVGCAAYDDRKFPPLPARHNVGALSLVLADTAIGDFTVDTLLDQPSGTVREQIEGFFADHRRDDLLLLYLSCHGVLDQHRRLHFVSRNTNNGRLDSTGISAQWIKERMDQSRSQRIVLLLDCCYSGAFNRGLTRGGAGAEKIFEQLGGRGRVVITASDKLELAHESEFTDAVVRGLRTGDADRDGDGLVSVYELYQYVHDQVRKNKPDQTPTCSVNEMRGELYLAKNPHTPLPLPDDLAQALKSEIAWMRMGAVDGLRRLLASDYPGGQKRTARQTLGLLCFADPDLDIREAAKEALGSLPSRPVPKPSRTRQRLIGAGLTLAVLGPLIFAPPAISSLSQCSPVTRSADGVLSLGTLLPKTGAFVYTGPPLDAGVQLAMKDINDAGGIPSIAAVKLDRDNQLDEGNPSTDTASRSTDALLSNEVDVIIGPATSASALQVIDKVTCAGVILFSPSNTSQTLTAYPDRGLYFRTSASTVVEGAALGKVMVDDGNSTAVVISRDDAYGNDMREATVNVIREFGRQVLDSFHYDPNSPDYAKIVQRVKDKNPDAIVLIGFTESARILSSMIKEGVGPKNKRVYTSVSNTNNTLAGQVSPQDPGILAGMEGSLPDPGDPVFVQRLREANPGLRDLNYAAQAYDAVVITALAAAIAGTDAPAAIAKEINGVTQVGEQCTSFSACMALVKNHKDIAYVGASGPLEFSDRGEPRAAKYLLVETQNDGTLKILR